MQRRVSTAIKNYPEFLKVGLLGCASHEEGEFLCQNLMQQGLIIEETRDSIEDDEHQSS